MYKDGTLGIVNFESASKKKLNKYVIVGDYNFLKLPGLVHIPLLNYTQNFWIFY